MSHGLRNGLISGLRNGLNPSGADLDPLAGIFVPSTAGQWSGLGLTAPTDLWLCDEASGNLVDEINGTVLTANATPLYQQSVTGWTRKAVGFNATLNQRFLNATYNNVATTSIMALAYILIGAAPAAIQGLLVAGTNTSGAGLTVTTAPRIRYRNSASISDTSSAYQSAVAPVVFVHDVTGSRARLITNTEKIAPTFGAAVGSLFGLGTGTSANFSCRCLAALKGAAAEMSDATIKTMLQTLRWTVRWSP